MSSTTPAEQVTEALSPYLGPFNAKISVKLYAQKALGCTPEQVTREDVPALLDALRPSLYTLVGRTSTDTLLDEISREVS